MKTGKSLQELAVELDRQNKAKRDFIVPTRRLRAVGNDGGITLDISGGIMQNAIEPFGLTTNGHKQLGGYCKIPAQYYDRMMTSGAYDLVATNINHWLQSVDARRMVRLLDGKMRAFLSDKYRRLDNFELCNNVLPLLIDAGAEVESCEVTDNKLYLKAITHKIQGEVSVGDTVSAGIIISNSETGHGSLSIKPMLLRLVCQNGMVVDSMAMRKYHVGRVQDEISFQNDTLKADDKAFWLKVRDLVNYTLSEVTFQKVIEAVASSTQKQIANPSQAIEEITKAYSLTEKESEGILAHLIKGGELTSWGLANAVTRHAHDVESYDRSVELESIGFEITQRRWGVSTNGKLVAVS